jgi:regulator of RNase E activity RraA
MTRCAAACADGVLVVAPAQWARRAQRAKKTLSISRGLRQNIKGGALD